MNFDLDSLRDLLRSLPPLDAKAIGLLVLSLVTAGLLTYIRIFRVIEFLLLLAVSFVAWATVFQYPPFAGIYSSAADLLQNRPR